MNRLAALALATILAGCAAANAGSSAALAGSEWQLLAIDGQSAADLENARLSFANDRLGGTVGCNRLGGNYRVANGRLIAGPIVQTEMYCGGALGVQEQALSALLVGAPEIRLSESRLLLVSSGHKAEFARIAG